jgi:DNA-binding XRE family transcriptional regulator
VGVTTQTIYSWKAGTSKPKTIHIHKIAKILKLSIDSLIDDFYK